MRDFTVLPETVEPEEATAYFEELLTEIDSNAALSSDIAVKSLFEITQRQISTYAPLDAHLRGPLEKAIQKYWDLNKPIVYVNKLLSVIINLELEGCVSLLEHAIQNPSVSDAVKTELQSALEEFQALKA